VTGAAAPAAGSRTSWRRAVSARSQWFARLAVFARRHDGPMTTRMGENLRASPRRTRLRPTHRPLETAATHHRQPQPHRPARPRRPRPDPLRTPLHTRLLRSPHWNVDPRRRQIHRNHVGGKGPSSSAPGGGRDRTGLACEAWSSRKRHGAAEHLPCHRQSLELDRQRGGGHGGSNPASSSE
jgi:hypothetical protein